MMAAANKQLIRRFITEVFDEGGLDSLDRYLTPGFMNHATGAIGIPAYRRVVEWTRRMQGDDCRNVIDDLLADDDRVCAFITIHGRLSNEVEVLGVRLNPDYRVFSARHAHTFRLAGGKIAKHWAIRDDLTMLRQLGFVISPPPESVSGKSS
jgi:predicted ester cyclase